MSNVHAWRSILGKAALAAALGAALIVAACAQGSGGAGSVSANGVSAPLPDGLAKLEPGQTLIVHALFTNIDTADVFEDDLVDVEVFDDGNQFRGNFPITLLAGDYDVELTFSVDDATFGTVQVATSTNTGPVRISGGPNEVSTATFASVDTDSDGDGTPNLDEINSGSDPENSAPQVVSTGGIAAGPALSLAGADPVAAWTELDTAASPVASIIGSLFPEADPPPVAEAGAVDDPERFAQVDVSTNGDGDSMLVATVFDSGAGTLELCSQLRTAGVGWDDATVDCGLDNGTDTVAFPRVLYRDDGTATAVWEEDDDIWSAEFDGANWGAPFVINLALGPPGRSLAVAKGADGSLAAVWRGFVSGGVDRFYHVWVNTWDPATAAWVGADLVDTNPAGTPHAVDAFDPAVSIDDGGDLLVTWRSADGSLSVVWSRARVAGTWEDARMVSAGTDAFHGRPLLNGGDARVVFRQSDGSHEATLLATENAGAWDVEALDSGPTDAWGPQIAGGPDGRFLASWVQADASGNDALMTRRFDGADLKGIGRADANHVGDVITGPTLTLGGDGTAYGLWVQADAVGNANAVFNSRF